MVLAETEVGRSSFRRAVVETTIGKLELYSTHEVQNLLQRYRNNFELIKSSASDLEKAEATGKAQIHRLLLRMLGQGNLLGKKESDMDLNPVKLIGEKETDTLVKAYSKARKAYVDRDIYGKSWPESYTAEDVFVESRMEGLGAILSELDQDGLRKSINIKIGLSKSQWNEMRTTDRGELR